MSWWGRMPKTHQHEVNRQPVQPRREGRFASKSVNFSEQKQKCFLRQVFRFGRISYHAQAYRIHASAMQAIEAFKRGTIAVARLLDSLRFGQSTAGSREDWQRSLLGDGFHAGMRIPVPAMSPLFGGGCVG